MFFFRCMERHTCRVSNCQYKGMCFHFGQAVFRKVTELGLKTTYTSRGPEYRYIRSLMALPFLPASQIKSAFNTLAARATSPALQHRLTYMESSWISNTVWQPRNWCVFQTSIRTNNDVEGWHTRINTDIGKANVSFYILVPALQRESQVIELTYRLVSEQQILRDQRHRYRHLEGRLNALWDRYEDDQISASQLLRECGHIYVPPSD